MLPSSLQPDYDLQVNCDSLFEWPFGLRVDLRVLFSYFARGFWPLLFSMTSFSLPDSLGFIALSERRQSLDAEWGGNVLSSTHCLDKASSSSTLYAFPLA